jgi:iron complex transport system substrate-binding protein
VHQRRLSLLLLVGAVALGLVVTACGGDDSTSKTTPATTAAASPSAATTAVATQAATTYPVKVTDLLGRQVEIKAKPKSVVALSPTAVELVYAAGGTVIGRTDTVSFPEAAKQAKSVGSAYQPSMETVLSLQPDLIVADSILDAQPQLSKVIEGSGIPVIYAGADSYQKVLDGLKLLGTVFDGKALTDKVAADVTKARDDAKAAIASKNISAVAILADQNQVIYAAKDGSYVGDVMKQVGITNPANPLPDSGPFPGYTAIPQDKLLAANPDYIFTTTPAPQPVPRLSTSIPQIPAFKTLKAVTTPNHVVEVPVELVLEAPGPRIIDLFKALRTAVAGQ